MDSFNGGNSDDGKGSAPSSPENDVEDTTMEEEAEADNDSNDDEKDTENDDDDNDDDNDENDADADGDAEADERHTSQQPLSPVRPRPSLQPGADTCSSYDIIPYVAAPQSTSINAFAATPCMRWVFTGGQDGYIRKFDWFASINGKVPLTVAQKHPFVDSVTRAGVLLSYWENEEIPDKNHLGVPDHSDEIKFSPVYSLATQHQALWLLSGLENGSVNLQSVRHDEGKIITVLRKHKSAVSCLALTANEKNAISGSWDKQIYDWDLNRGEVARHFGDATGQICELAFRPESSLPIPINKEPLANGGLENTSKASVSNGALTNGITHTPVKLEGENGDAPGSPDSSRSFGSLFGDDDEDIKLDDDDEFGQAIANGRTNRANSSANGMMDEDTMMTEAPEHSANVNSNTPNGNLVNSATRAMSNGIEERLDMMEPDSAPPKPPSPSPILQGQQENMEESFTPGADSSSCFLAASADGTIRIFDRRQDLPVAKMFPGKGVPPWCRSACWSTDGNFIYAGRRNATVEEYSVHKGFGEPYRTLKLPQVSGAVSVVAAMPNSKHLVCASFDNLRLYDLNETSTRSSAVPFLIVPGHHGGVVSSIFVDQTCRYIISTGGNRGWEGLTTEVLLGYEVVVSQ